MAEIAPSDASRGSDAYLKGTTYRVYRYLLKQRGQWESPTCRGGWISALPQSLSTTSGSSCGSASSGRSRKGYVIDKMVLENVVRIRRVSVPTQTGYLAFFGVTFFVLLVFLRPATINSLYFFAVVVNVAALAVSLYEVGKTLKRL